LFILWLFALLLQVPNWPMGENNALEKSVQANHGMHYMTDAAST